VTLYAIDRHSRHRDLLCGRPGTTTRASRAIGRAPSGDGTQSHRTGVSYSVTVTRGGLTDRAGRGFCGRVELSCQFRGHRLEPGARNREAAAEIDNLLRNHAG